VLGAVFLVVMFAFVSGFFRGMNFDCGFLLFVFFLLVVFFMVVGFFSIVRMREAFGFRFLFVVCFFIAFKFGSADLQRSINAILRLFLLGFDKCGTQSGDLIVAQICIARSFGLGLASFG